MGKHNTNPDPGDEKFLDDIASAFEDRKDPAVRDAVRRKIETTYFPGPKASPLSKAPWMKFGVITLAITVAVIIPLIFFMQSGDEENMKSQTEKITANEQTQNQRIEPEEQSGKYIEYESGRESDASQHETGSSNEEIAKITESRNFSEGNREIKESSASVPAGRVVVQDTTSVSTDMPLPDNIDIADFRKKVSAMLNRYEMKLQENKGDNNAFFIKTERLSGKLANDAKVDFFYQFWIKDNDPDKIYIKFKYFELKMPDKNLDYRKNTEKLFYENLIPELKSIIESYAR